MKLTSVKIIFITVLVILFSMPFTIVAQDKELENSLLWEISGNDLEKPSYLFGTIHMIPKEDFFFTGLMKEKFESCNTLVLEINLDIPLKEQMDIVENTSIENQLSELEINGDFLGEYYKLMDYYKEQNITAFQEMFNEMEDTDFEQRFLTDRNTKWISKLEKIMENGSVFVAVGAAHLVGDHGLILLLSEKGYTVLPLK